MYILIPGGDKENPFAPSEFKYNKQTNKLNTQKQNKKKDPV